jgi:hypothetical protein
MAGNRGAEELRELKEREGRAVGSKKRRRGCGSHGKKSTYPHKL